MIWKLNDRNFEEYSTINAAHVISKYNQDYVKVTIVIILQCLCYNNEQRYLFAGAFDGNLTYFKIDDYVSRGMISYDTDNYLFKSQNQSSFFSVDCEKSGKFILASMYQSVRSQ